MSRISRRALGALLASATAWLGMSPALASPQRKLLALFGEYPAALGPLCLRALSGQSARQLAEAVLKSCGGAGRNAVAARIREDFVQGAVIDVDGWQLSLTETRLCALAALAGRQTV